MNNLSKLAIAGVVSLALGGCTSGAGPKESAGTVGGAVLGGLAGSQIGGGSGRLVAVGVGTLLGGLIGAEIGRSLDRADRAYLEQTTQGALETNPSGTSSSWSNPDSGNSGHVTPQRTYQSASGQYCREYQQTVVVGGRKESAYGTACRQPDGTWRVTS